jgi:hypothetical protein
MAVKMLVVASALCAEQDYLGRAALLRRRV